MKRINITTVAALALTGLLVVSAGPAMAALSYDSETTNTTTTSDLVGGETVKNLDNETTYKRIEVVSGNATTSGLTNPEEAFTLKLSVNDPDNGDDGYTFYSNASTFVEEDATNGHYSINLSHAEMFAELPREVGENVTVDATVTFNETETDEESSTITIYAQNGNDRAVEVVTDDDVDTESNVELTNESRLLRNDLDFASVESDENIDANTTRVSYVFANDTVAEKYTTAYDVASFGSGDYIYSMTATVDGTPIMIFDSKQGDDRDAGIFSGGFDGDDDTYGVYENNGGEYGENARLDIYPQGDDAETGELEIESSGNKSLGFWANLKNFGSDAASASGIGIVPEA